MSFERFAGSENILKIPFCPSFKSILRKNIKYLKDNDMGELKLSPTGIEPLDKWVWALYKHIEDYYNIKFTLKEFLEIRNAYINDWGKGSEAYFKCFETDVERAIIRLPDGTELEDMTFGPIYFFFESQNMMLLRFIEIKAQEKALENYINEMLGDTSKSRKLEELEDEYEKLFHVHPEQRTAKEGAAKISAAEDLRRARDSAQEQVMKEIGAMGRLFRLFDRGSYEPRFDDVVTGPFFSNNIGHSMMGMWQFLKGKFDVPGFSIPGVK